MQSIINFYNAHQVLIGYAANTVVTLLIGIPKSSPFWRLVKLIHGAIEKIDPPPPKPESKES